MRSIVGSSTLSSLFIFLVEVFAFSSFAFDLEFAVKEVMVEVDAAAEPLFFFSFILLFEEILSANDVTCNFLKIKNKYMSIHNTFHFIFQT